VSGAIREVDGLNDYSASTVVPSEPEASGVSICPGDADKNLTVAAGNVAPAGVVRIPGEELLEAIESEEDIVKANRELTEGTDQNRSELGRWQRLYGEVMDECNKRLKSQGVMLLVAVPEPHGLGCVFTGVDAARYEAAKNGGVFSPGGEDYEVTLSLPARQRVDIMATGRENFVRTMIGWVCDATLEQKRAFLARTVH
jgi:hypothetical protein